MGCDIHMYVEWKVKSRNDNYWDTFGGCINPGRDYELFGLLAGVRSDEVPMFPIRGIPDNMAFESRYDYYYYVVENKKDTDENYVTRKNAEEWVAAGLSTWKDTDHKLVSGPDWHTPSWLTYAEFKKVLTGLDVEVTYKALLVDMMALTDHGKNDVRVVFWFDN